jgi:hypothetical protein
MNDESTKNRAAAVRPYEVGYGKPPVHTRFQKGVSGNPRGGSRKVKQRRARDLAIREAYRLVTVREGDRTMRLPALQAVMRSQVALAAKGNGPAQRRTCPADPALPAGPSGVNAPRGLRESAPALSIPRPACEAG